MEDSLSRSEGRVAVPERIRFSGLAPVISSSTRWVAAVMIVAVAGGAALDYLATAGLVSGLRSLVLAGLTLVPLPVAALVLGVSRSFARGPIRAQWMLFGLGMLSVGAGGAIFVVLYITTGHDPYPSVGDVFTLSGYALFAAGLVLAIRAHTGLLSIRQPLLIAALVAMSIMALVYFTVIGPYVVFAADHTQSVVTRVLNTLYPVLDVLVLLGPAIALGLIVRKLGAGRLAWPWWCIVASTGILAVTDVVFAYAGYVGAGRSPLIDSGYAFAPMLLGLAVCVARDVYSS